MVAASMLLAHAAQAQEASHFTYTGALRVNGNVVAETDHVPLRNVRLLDGGQIAMSLRHEGLRFEARGDRAGLQFHVHAWTEARAEGFTVFIAPDTRVDVIEGATRERVIFGHAQLGDVTLGRPHALPAWLETHIAEEPRRYTSCQATTLYAHASEESASRAIDAGQTLYTHPARGDWQETWARVETHWVRGFARGVHCEVADIGLGQSSLLSVSGFSDRPPHVLLPPGLRLVSPMHPGRVVLRVTQPVDAISWGPGWSSANDEGALTIAFPCGMGTWTGHLTIASSRLVPEGAPRRIR